MCSTCCRCCCRSYPVNHGQPWTPREARTLQRMYINGFTFKQIANKLGRTTVSIRMRLGY